VTKQDQRIGGMIDEARRSCIILVNKWDLATVEEKKARKPLARGKMPPTFREEYLTALRKELFFLDWAPVLFASAKTGERVQDLFSLIARVEQARQDHADTPRLNQVLSRAITSYPPPYIHAKRFKIFYAFQKPGTSPTFVLFVNDVRCLTPHYQRYLADQIRKEWEFTGCPVVFECRARTRKSFAEK
jgi:GTP-binding protein